MPDIPYGRCQCGCGGKTNFATRTSKTRGDKAGMPVKYIYGHGRTGKLIPLKERLWSKVKVTGIDDCWIWQGAKAGDPERERKFGRYGILINKGKQYIASRVMWEVTRGHSIPEGLKVLHKCDNPPCCNPSHLFIGTHQDNMTDMMDKGRGKQHVNPPSGIRQHMAKLTDEIVRYARSVYKRGNASLLAEQFGVSYRVMSKAITGKTWKHVK